MLFFCIYFFKIVKVEKTEREIRQSYASQGMEGIEINPSAPFYRLLKAVRPFTNVSTGFAMKWNG